LAKGTGGLKPTTAGKRDGLDDGVAL
jgi:hypothetical protein